MQTMNTPPPAPLGSALRDAIHKRDTAELRRVVETLQGENRRLRERVAQLENERKV